MKLAARGNESIIHERCGKSNLNFAAADLSGCVRCSFVLRWDGVRCMKKGLSQEQLKGIACCAMLLDHIGSMLVPALWLRAVGRIAFPIFCFLVSEGIRRTRNLQRYIVRLGIAAILSELPFDLAFFGGVNWGHQNVMVTLLLGALTLSCMSRIRNLPGKILAALLGTLLAEVLRADYGGMGVLLIILFHEARKNRGILLPGMAVLMILRRIGEGIFAAVLQMFAILSMIPISLYSGRKETKRKTVQLAFYLFYPAHLLILCAIKCAVL